MKITTLLPMKAHSERVPNKNMRDFNGRPLYHAVMKSLQNSRYIAKIVINTDSDKIKQDALCFFGDRVTIHNRPENIRGDLVSMNQIIANDLERLEGEHFLQTHSTNPLLRSGTISKAVQALLTSFPAYDSLFSVSRLQTRLWDQLGRPINHNPAILLQTQDLPPVYEENSCIYIFTRANLLARRNRLGERPLMFPIDPAEAWDIDEELDFAIVNLLMEKSVN